MAKKYQNQLQITLSNQSDSLIQQLPDFANKYFDSLRNRNLSERTITQYAYDMLNFFDFLGKSAGYAQKNIKTMTASEVLDPLTIDDLNEYFKTLEYTYSTNAEGKTIKKKTSPSYRARKASSLRSFFRYYIKIKAISNALGELIESPKLPFKNIIILENNDVKRLLAAIKDTTNMSNRDKSVHDALELRDIAIIVLFLGSGIRVSELIGIDIQDVDFYNASIVINRKGGDIDEVYFNEEVEKALSEYVEHCRPSLLKSNQKETALFVSLQGTRLTTRAVEKLVKKYGTKAGLNIDLHPHSLRKTYGTTLYENSGDLLLVADALHHKSIETGRKFYIRSSEANKRRAAKYSTKIFEQ